MGRDRAELHENLTSVAYYVSDYGYGHAARSIAVIRRLLADSPEPLRLIIHCGKALGFMYESLQEDSRHQLEFRTVSSDTGYVLKQDSIAADTEGLRNKYRQDLSLLGERVEQEREFLLQQRVQLVISDISPIPIVAAARAGIESLGISNFTWYTAYRDMLEPVELDALRTAYARMDHFIGLAGCAEPAWGCKDRIHTGFFCRQPDAREVARIRRKLNPDGTRKIVFFALGMSIEVGELERLPLWNSEGYSFIVSSNVQLEREHIARIPFHYSESQNYLAAADLVITKPGWGTIGEAVTLGKPLLLLNRSQFYEDRHTVAAIPNHHPYMLMSWEEISRLDLNDLPAVEQPDSYRSIQRHGVQAVREDALGEITGYIRNLLHQVRV
ncbi:glycosyltransferase [Paenibacillus sp. WLX1005]|uniref:glycosyltransferase n=1 Tax=Paenibacillus sp. WLX1005 TaxID=3243766 RepID=UPI003984080A